MKPKFSVLPLAFALGIFSSSLVLIILYLFSMFQYWLLALLVLPFVTGGTVALQYIDQLTAVYWANQLEREWKYYQIRSMRERTWMTPQEQALVLGEERPEGATPPVGVFYREVERSIRAKPIEPLEVETPDPFGASWRLAFERTCDWAGARGGWTVDHLVGEGLAFTSEPDWVEVTNEMAKNGWLIKRTGVATRPPKNMTVDIIRGKVLQRAIIHPATIAPDIPPVGGGVLPLQKPEKLKP